MASIKEDTIIHLDFTIEPPCESGVHGSEDIHSGPAGFWQDGLCVHATGFRCVKYVEHVKGLRVGALLQCLACGTKHDVSALRFTAI